MTSEKHDEKAIFNIARNIESPKARTEYLHQICGSDENLIERVETLLSAYDAQASFLESPAVSFAATTEQRPIAEQPGAVIGPYKLLQQIGEGGMGVVFMAEQEEPVHRTVALKIIKPGMDSRQVIARFEAERQALALMDHPNIAKVFEAGATETSRPYFVMELVKGVPITEYCDQQHFSIRERAQLFTQVCHAVQHAHQKGIIHRDLKPSNVLVAEYDGKPVPKVIDFGVAKATAQKLTERTMFTELGQVIGTVEYMSPEQARFNQLDVDTRSDIYSLGVLLYELLTGSTPLKREWLRSAAFDEILRMIGEEEPPKPSTRLSSSETLPSISAQRHSEPAKLTNLVRGELDWIVMKSLEKDRNRRYETAGGFAADVHRYLNDEAVQARPATPAYRFKKFVRRNRFAFMTAALTCAMLVLSTVVSVWQAVRATQAAHLAELSRQAEAEQRTEAELQRQQAEANERIAKSETAKTQQVANFLKEMFGGTTPWVARSRDTEVLQEIMDKAATRFGMDLSEQPEVEAELRNIMGHSYWSITEHQKSEIMHRRALELSRGLENSEHPLVSQSLAGLALSLRDQGKRTEAEAALREALALQRKQFGSESREVADTLRDLGMVLPAEKRSEAEALERESLRIRRKLYGNERREVADSLNRLSGVLGEGQISEAESLLREAVAIMKKLSPNSSDTILAQLLYSLAINLQHQGKLPEAEAAARESLSVMTKATGLGSSWTVSPFYRLMIILGMEGKTEELEQLFQHYPIPREGRQGYIADLQSCRAELFSDKKDFREAEISYREALDIRKRILRDNHPLTIESLNGLIDVLEQEGKPNEAESLRLEFDILNTTSSPKQETN